MKANRKQVQENTERLISAAEIQTARAGNRGSVCGKSSLNTDVGNRCKLEPLLLKRFVV